MRLRRLVLCFLIFSGAIVLFIAFIAQLREVLYNPGKLVLHQGTLVAKQLKDTVRDKMPANYILLTLSNGNTYKAQQYARYINDEVNIGDTVKLYTKPLSGMFGNMVSDESGSHIWTSHNPNEVYHLVTTRNNVTVIDFALHKLHMKQMIWIWPFFSLCFFVWGLVMLARWGDR